MKYSQNETFLFPRFTAILTAILKDIELQGSLPEKHVTVLLLIKLSSKTGMFSSVCVQDSNVHVSSSYKKFLKNHMKMYGLGIKKDKLIILSSLKNRKKQKTKTGLPSVDVISRLG